jgi:small subunit ribosomal protein S10e
MDIRHIECFLVMRSLKSRKYVTEVFIWQHRYYFLKNEGVKFLREYLGLPQTVIPNTHKVDRSEKREDDEEGEGREGETEGREGREDRPRGRGRGTRGRGGFRGRREEHQEA